MAGAAVTSTYNASTGDLRLNYTHSGLSQVQITGGGRTPLLLLIANNGITDTIWRQDTAAGAVLVRGPELVRTASTSGGTLALTGDSSAASSLEVWAPPSITAVTWNGAAVATRTSSTGSLTSTAQLAGPDAVTLPALTSWRFSAESPEKAVNFDDSSWAAANKTSTNSTTKPPAGQPVLTADDYGFHYGDVWYRGRFSGTAPATVSLNYGGGGAGMVQAWLDGTYLGQNVLPNGVSSPTTRGTASFPVPSSLRVGGNHVLSVMVRNDGHNEDGAVNDAHKEGRGLISVSYANSSGGSVSLSTTWKIQGSAGGENLADPARGPLNTGGLYGERNRWHLPGFNDSSWANRSVPDTSGAPAGTSWYRTTFTLNVPTGEDASLGLTIGDPSVPRSGGKYRALIYVNGWNIGQYIANVGPQHTFVVPNGILNPNGSNTVALAVTSDGGSGNGLERVALTNLGTVRGGVPVALNTAPTS